MFLNLLFDAFASSTEFLVIEVNALTLFVLAVQAARLHVLHQAIAIHLAVLLTLFAFGASLFRG